MELSEQYAHLQTAHRALQAAISHLLPEVAKALIKEPAAALLRNLSKLVANYYLGGRRMRPSVAVIASAFGTIFVALPGYAETIYADAYLTVGRYSAYRTAPDLDQLNPLAQIVNVKFPEVRVRTVGQALQHLLRGSGYSQIFRPDPYAAALLDKPLPKVHRQLGPMPLATALTILVGQPYEILVNDVQRQICVELKKTVDPQTMTTLTAALNVDPIDSTLPHPAPPPIRPIRNEKPQQIAVAQRSFRPVIVNFAGSEGYVRR